MSTVTLTLQKAAFTQSGKDLKVCCEIDVEPAQKGTFDQEPLSREVMLTNAEIVSGTVYDLICYLNAEDKIAVMADKELTDLYEWDNLEQQLDQQYYGEDREFY